jgi:DNA-binding CsgD family transcriptional regulator
VTVAEIDPFIDADTVSAPTLREVVESAPTLTVVGGPLVRPALSTREVEVLLAWLAAESKEDAAAHLFISASTVSTHISRIRTKYSAVSRPAPTKAHLLARALQDGYTTLDVW